MARTKGDTHVAARAFALNNKIRGTGDLAGRDSRARAFFFPDIKSAPDEFPFVLSVSTWIASLSAARCRFFSLSPNPETQRHVFSLSFHAFLESLSAPLVHRFVTSYYYYYNEMYSFSLSPFTTTTCTWHFTRNVGGGIRKRRQAGREGGREEEEERGEREKES